MTLFRNSASKLTATKKQPVVPTLSGCNLVDNSLILVRKMIFSEGQTKQMLVLNVEKRGTWKASCGDWSIPFQSCHPALKSVLFHKLNLTSCKQVMV